ncbi:MAG: hypothetical protein ACI9WU_002614 [Myxococcota bacterium]|jgi:uncharacterized protein (DUF58 family)
MELFDEQFLRRLETLHLVSKRVHAGAQKAERRSKKVGSGLEFADHRDYAAGDDLRHLDWRVFARMEKMLVRVYEEEEDLQIYFLLDCSQSMSVGYGGTTKWQHAARLAAALGYVGLANLDRVSVVPFGAQILDRMPPTRGKNQVFKLFRFIEGLETGGVTCMGDSLRKFVHQNKRKGMAVILSDFYDPAGYEDAINYLRYNNFEPMVMHLTDEDEVKAALRGDLTLVDCETGAVREITVTPKLLRRYAQVHKEFCDQLERHCKTKNVSYFRTPIQLPWDDTILQLFRAGGFLK